MVDDRSPRRRVAVLGGINRDSITRVRELPAPGETALALGVAESLGGKGANQAVAAARTGTEVVLVGAVGSDAAGREVLRDLSAAGVEVESIVRIGAPTGRAAIWVAESGSNSIVVTAGANGRLSVGDLAGLGRWLEGSAVLVVQGEIPAAVTIAAATEAERRGIRVLVNLAPFRDDLSAAVALADPLVVNEIEASQLLGVPVSEVDTLSAASALVARCRSAIVTLGSAGAILVRPDGSERIPAPVASDVVDTTGAGDAFVGVLAAALAAGAALGAAARDAVRAATSSVGVPGAGTNYPAFRLTDHSAVRG